MENPYRGDPGVPHAAPEQLVKSWMGCFAIASVAAFNPWNLVGRFNWQDKVMRFEHNHWKKVMKKKQA